MEWPSQEGEVLFHEDTTVIVFVQPRSQARIAGIKSLLTLDLPSSHPAALASWYRAKRELAPLSQVTPAIISSMTGTAPVKEELRGNRLCRRSQLPIPFSSGDKTVHPDPQTLHHLARVIVYKAEACIL